MTIVAHLLNMTIEIFSVRNVRLSYNYCDFE